ncbi:MAG TPA: hypothetical protein VF447_05830, partial [Terriglobales bacterium]
NSLPDLSLRESTALWPAALMALIMGVAPLLWLNGIDPAVHNVLHPQPPTPVVSSTHSPALPQLVSKVVGQ